MNINKILITNYPNQKWALTGDAYEGLEWLDESEKPTEEELISQWDEVQSKIAIAEQARIDAKNSAIAKLEALGLTVEEVEVAFGLSA